MDWIGLHLLGCVAVHICVALNDCIVWSECISIGLHWRWIGLDWKLHIFVGLHWIGIFQFPLGKKLDWIALCGLRCIPNLRCFE